MEFNSQWRRVPVNQAYSLAVLDSDAGDCQSATVLYEFPQALESNKLGKASIMGQLPGVSLHSTDETNIIGRWLQLRDTQGVQVSCCQIEISTTPIDSGKNTGERDSDKKNDTEGAAGLGFSDELIARSADVDSDEGDEGFKSPEARKRER